MPISIEPKSVRFRTEAPPSVAISRASRALMEFAPFFTRCSKSNCLASDSKCPASLDADPSTPRPTFTPPSLISRIGAMPDPNLQFEQGQWATPVLVLANKLISSEFNLTQ